MRVRNIAAIFFVLNSAVIEAKTNSWSFDMGQGIYEFMIQNNVGHKFFIDCISTGSLSGSLHGASVDFWLNKNGREFAAKTNELLLSFNGKKIKVPSEVKDKESKDTVSYILDGIKKNNSFDVFYKGKMISSFVYNSEEAKKVVFSGSDCIDQEY